MLCATARIFMDETLRWTLVSTCAVCAHETTSLLVMGVPPSCAQCGCRIRIDPATTVFHRTSGSGYWAW
jgi:hypothetical protein